MDEQAFLRTLFPPSLIFPWNPKNEVAFSWTGSDLLENRYKNLFSPQDLVSPLLPPPVKQMLVLEVSLIGANIQCAGRRTRRS